MASVLRPLSLLLSRSSRVAASSCSKTSTQTLWRRSGGYRLRASGLRRLGSSSSAVLSQENRSGGSEAPGNGLTLSDSCVKQLVRVIREKPGLMLRVTVDGGGCSGFQYRMEFDTKVNSDDKVFERDGVCVVVDDLSLGLLEGCTVDYHQELIRAAFRIVGNPNAESSCSCGTSFALK